MEAVKKQCRACLTQDDVLHPLFVDENNFYDVEDSILNMFTRSTSLKATLEDRYPKFICNNCFLDLLRANDFWKRCRLSMTKLDEINENFIDNDAITFETIAEDHNSGQTLSYVNKEQSKSQQRPKTEAHLCDVCGKVFSNGSRYRRHASVHSDYRRYKCKICNKQYKEISAIHVHMQNHKNEKRYSCTYCGEKFNTWNTRFCHIRTHHTTEKQFVCEICDKSFKLKSSLKSHLVYHTGEKSHSCSICSKSYSHSKSLKDHMYTHFKEKQPLCKICEKRFCTPKSLRQHMQLMHSNRQKPLCEVCNKSFSTVHVLRNHMKQHKQKDSE